MVVWNMACYRDNRMNVVLFSCRREEGASFAKYYLACSERGSGSCQDKAWSVTTRREKMNVNHWRKCL